MEVVYVNHLGEEINLTKWPLMLQEPEKMLASEWSYTTASEIGITGFDKELKEVEVTVSVFADSDEEYRTVMDELLSITEKDIIADQPGKIWINEYYLPCFIRKGEYEEYEEDFYATDKKLTVLSHKWMWIKETLTKYRYEDKQSTSGYDYPHDYPHPYGINNGFYGSLENSHFTESNFVMIIYGYAVNPCVVVGGNVYRLNCTIKEGDRIIINSANQTITLIHANDQRENAFRYRDQTNDIFRKIPSGTSSVLWNAKFDFDIWVCTERSEPEWST